MMNRILLLLDRKPTLSEAAFTEMMLNTLRKDGSPYRIYKSNQTSVLLAVVTQNFGDEQTVKRLAAQHFGPQWDFANDEYQEFKGPFGEQGACLVSWRSEAPDADDKRVATSQQPTAPKPSGQSVDLQLLEAAENGDSQQLKSLLDRGANLNAADEQGNTALHKAARSVRQDCCEILLTRGLSPNVANRAGKTPLDVAIELDMKMRLGATAAFGAAGTQIAQASQESMLRLLDLFKDKGANRPSRVDEKSWRLCGSKSVVEDANTTSVKKWWEFWK
jgi:hypothetical protein